MDQTEKLLKEITEAGGVPGYESDVRAIMRKYLASVAEIEQDKMGSFIGKHRGSEDHPRVMLAGHMDEIGFMVKLVTKEGFIKFVPLGGWWDQVMLGHRVLIKTFISTAADQQSLMAFAATFSAVKSSQYHRPKRKKRKQTSKASPKARFP